MIERRKTRTVWVGDDRVGRFGIGSDARVAVQTMTAGYTHDIDACVAEINRYADAGVDIVRVAVPERKDTEALKHIIPQVKVPLVADVHFHFQRALEAVEAGIHKIRLNPGNISDRDQVNKVIDACKERGIPIRIGVNEGSIIERKDKQRRMEELGIYFEGHKSGHLLALMIAKLEEYLDIFDARGFHDVAISAKSMDASLVIDIYTEISKRFDYPLHLGVTHAGTVDTGRIRSISALSTLVANGIGDTVRISYASDHIDEVKDALEMLYCLGKRERKGVELIACPTCGRIQVDLFTLVKEVERKLMPELQLPVKVAVMGCIVNGPGEAEGADVAVFAGDRRGIIYVQGERVANVPEEEILDRLLVECKTFEDRVRRGEAKIGQKKVEIVPPAPIGELGSGAEKIRAGLVDKVTVGRSGFTIVEMLVVIGIITLLLGLGLGALTGAIGRGKKTKELNWLRQIHTAWMLYSGNSEEQILPGFVDEATQQSWKVTYRNTNGQTLNRSLAQTYVWRLAPYLDFNIEPFLSYRGGSELTMDESRYYPPELEAMPPGWMAPSIELNGAGAAFQPAIGYNAYYCGGWWAAAQPGLPPQLTFADGSFVDSAGTTLRGRVVVRNQGAIQKPDSWMIFGSSVYAPQGRFNAFSDSAPGAAWITPPKLANIDVWTLSATAGSISPDGSSGGEGVQIQGAGDMTVLRAEAVPMARYGGKTVALGFADGHTDTLTLQALLDPRIWVDAARERTFTHMPN
ncbi:MAG: flavodoxin-dependent (E)-4-hydroxy-3-methylbut-2-enyl-diphosphate synthase [Phycisphaerales bacterium]|nr:flavodoxin-dependent (E)-4-hydroxy-3-methylbut-2-enyl-diphosphate synthase [Phycisphaerales bacterium]